MQLNTAADRTRSRRWRSGTRRNKKHPTAHIAVCPKRGVCLVHTPGHPDMILGRRPKTMRMVLTPCEQAWVDDVRSGRVHMHLKPFGHDSRRERRYRAVRLVYREMVSARMHRRGTVNAESPTGRFRHGQPALQNIKPVIGVDYGYVHPGSRGAITAAIDAEKDRLQEMSTLEIGGSRYLPRRSMDISDRWYPRGE